MLPKALWPYLQRDVLNQLKKSNSKTVKTGISTGEGVKVYPLTKMISQFRKLLSKPLTFVQMENLDLFFRRVCYHQNPFYRNVKGIKAGVGKLSICKPLFCSCFAPNFI